MFDAGAQVTLLDSTRKKCTFLEEVAADLQLNNVQVVWQRAEEAGNTAKLREAGAMTFLHWGPHHCV